MDEIRARVIDLYSVKPVDVKTLRDAVGDSIDAEVKAVHVRTAPDGEATFQWVLARKAAPS